MNIFIQHIIDLLDEPSTWRGLVWVLTSFGVILSPDQKESIVATGMAVAGLIGMFTSDKKVIKKELDQLEVNQSVKTQEMLSNLEKESSETNKTVYETTKKPSDNFFNDK